MDEIIRLPHFDYDILITLFKNITNAMDLRARLISGDENFKVALIDARMIYSRRHLLAAIHKALLNEQQDNLKAANLNSEILYALNPSPSIVKSFQQFGIKDDSEHLIVLIVKPTEENVANVLNTIKGEHLSFTNKELSNISDFNAISKVYKLGKTPSSDHELAIISTIAIRDVL